MGMVMAPTVEKAAKVRRLPLGRRGSAEAQTLPGPPSYLFDRSMNGKAPRSAEGFRVLSRLQYSSSLKKKSSFDG